jgi:multicomponent Na+:H+ antiporter subunit D
VRRILSFTVVSSIGYMILGLAISTPLAIAAGIFYMFQDIIAKAALFLFGGLIRRMTGSEDLGASGGIWAARPWLASVFLIPAFSLGGIPPLSGFWAKLMIVQATIAEGRWFATFLALAVGLLTLWAVTRIWLASFWASHPTGEAPLRWPLPIAMLAPVLALAGGTVLIGVWAGPFIGFAMSISEQILDPVLYIGAVLGEAP